MNYLHYDVFTERALLGNQLAVFPDARGLTTEQMQAIAREINFSESTFVLPAERADTDIRMRIFTPGVEMPMAGHPTVGSTFALGHLGVIPAGRKRFVFGLNVGPTPVDIEWDGDRVRFVWMTQAQPTFGRPVGDRRAVASAIGLPLGDLVETLPIQEVSCGVPYLIVPLRDREAVDRASGNSVAMLELPELSRSHPAILMFAYEGVRLKPDTTAAVRLKPDTTAAVRLKPDTTASVRLTPETTDADATEDTTYSRMFAPGLGVLEDPATGSAAGPLGCYLVEHELVTAAAARRMTNVQGVKMGRASRIHISIAGGPGAITDVKVGGASVLVARGEFLAVSASVEATAHAAP
jgi:trans-2,3-dihydro-3-hydroxyanthranilate isomerase